MASGKSCRYVKIVGYPFSSYLVRIRLRRCIVFSFSFTTGPTLSNALHPQHCQLRPSITIWTMDPTIAITTPSVYASSLTVLVLQILFMSIQKNASYSSGANAHSCAGSILLALCVSWMVNCSAGSNNDN